MDGGVLTKNKQFLLINSSICHLLLGEITLKTISLMLTIIRQNSLSKSPKNRLEKVFKIR